MLGFLYDKSAEGLKNRKLALLAFRRNMELARVSILGGALALFIGMPARFPLTPHGLTIMRLIPSVLVVVTWIPLTILRRTAPHKIIDRFVQVIEQEKNSGRPIKVVSRAFVLLAGALSFGLGLLIVMYVPIRR